MDEKRVKPLVKEINPAQEELVSASKTADSPQDDLSLNREAKDPEKLRRAFQTQRSFLADGGFREFILPPVVSDDPTFQFVRKSLGLNESEAGTFREEVAWITKKACEWIQTDDPYQLNKFVKSLTKFLPANGSRIHNIKVALAKLYEDEKQARLWQR